MRFHRLDLIKYGKFSDCTIDFPIAKHDFHLIVGPNEAGKSTLRSAIVDLLFGLPHRSTFGFLHPLNELRLGAYISNKSGVLEFHRTKAQKQPLRSPQNNPLADTVLTPFLGAADRNFFDQMFGLDHKKLVEGGNSILNSENDVGQILFQAAAGVGSLGKVRDALMAEADKLWAPRKSADRAYYIAVHQLEAANVVLKQATVRTKAWEEASRKAETLQEMIDSERARHGQLQAERNRLERIRRLAPFLRIFRENEKQLNALSEASDLSADAASIFSTAEQAFAKASPLLELGNNAVKRTKYDLGEIQMNNAVLGIAADIKKLDELRLRYGAHERDIERRETEKSISLARCLQCMYAARLEIRIRRDGCKASSYASRTPRTRTIGSRSQRPDREFTGRGTSREEQVIGHPILDRSTCGIAVERGQSRSSSQRSKM